MQTLRAPRQFEPVDSEWISFPGGELEGRRPRALCPACREKLQQRASGRAPLPGRATEALCFSCYRIELDRTRALRAAANLDTASTERFQFALPLEPVNVARLQMLRSARQAARVQASAGVGQFVDRRRRAQIEARRALAQLAAGLKARTDGEQRVAMAMAAHVAEMQLPEAWLPFVVSR